MKSIRILTDKDTGKPKGFAFVEYFDTNTALSAITHLDQTEMNNRKIKVGYPAQSNLRDIARQIGHVVPAALTDVNNQSLSINSVATLSSLLDSMKLHELWDVLDAMKKLIIADNHRNQKARSILETHPQLIGAMYEIHKRLGIMLPANIVLQQQEEMTSTLPVRPFDGTTNGAVPPPQKMIRTDVPMEVVSQPSLYFQPPQQMFQQQQQQQVTSDYNDQTNNLFYSQQFNDNINFNNNMNNMNNINNINNMNNNINNNMNSMNMNNMSAGG